MQPLPTIEQPGVLQKSIHGGKWLTIGYILQRAVGFVSFFVLARLLTPADFGIVAIMLLVPKLLQSATEPGFATAAIQKTGDVKKYLNPIWTIGILKSALIAVVVWFMAPFIAHLLNAEQAVNAIRWGGLFILVQNLSNIGELFLFRDLFFKRVVARNAIRDISYTIIAIAGALLWHSYTALIFATFASYAFQSISTYFLHPYRPRLTFNFKPLKDLYHYSKWVVGQGWLDQVYGFAEQSVVTRLGGVTNIGLYSKAKNMASVPTGFLSPVISTVSFSAYARIKDEPEKIREGFMKSLEIIFFLLIPITILILYAGGKLILILLGTVWLPMTNPLRVLLIYYFIGSINDLCNTLLNALGYPKKEVQYNFIKVLVTLLLLIPLTLWGGTTGAALAVLAGTIPTLVLNLAATVRYINIPLKKILKAVLVPLIASALTAAPCIVFKNVLLALPTSLFIIATAAAGLLYCGCIFFAGTLFNRGPYKTVRLIVEHIV